MADFKKFDLTKNVPITYGNSAQSPAQASDEPMRAALNKVKQFLGDMHAMPIDWTIRESQLIYLTVCDAIATPQSSGNAGELAPRATADVERLLAALQKIARNETTVFDEDEGCDVVVSMDTEEMIAIAEEAIAATKGVKP